MAVLALAMLAVPAAAEDRAQPGDGAIGGTAILPPQALDAEPFDTRRPLPRVLPQADAARYRRIFELQEAGKMGAAAKEIARLGDRILIGHVQSQRYLHPTAYRSSWRELRDWLERYADHPDAQRIHRLALKRKPKSEPAPRAPVKGYLGGSGADAVVDVTLYVSPKRRTKSELASIRRIKRDIRRLIGRGYPTGALRRLEKSDAKELLDPVEYAEQRGRIAHGYFIFGKDKAAYDLAARSAREAGDTIPSVHWTAGLAAWRLGDIATAAGHFEALAVADRASRMERAAGAYWASRTNLHLRRLSNATRWLARAAQYPLTFYGLLGRRALGIEVPFDWSLPTLSEKRLAGLMAHPGGRRALALMQIGQSRRAEQELRKLFPRLEPDLREPMMALATEYNMPGLAIRLAGIIRVSTGRTYHAALYPVPDWQPENGFEIDRAVVYGIIRQESGFDPRARSGRGARGLMQLMPRTASSMDHDDDLDDRHELYRPELNMALGQRYVGHLLGMKRVEGDMFRLLAAYNAGPGNLNKWRQKVDYRNDPLLFIESIPSRETREFIEKVLANIWIYRYRLGQPSPSLDRAAAGDWPRYESVDGSTGFVVRNARY